MRAGQNGGQSNSQQQLHDVKAAVMGNEPVVVQIIHQICDLREALAFLNDKSTDHGFRREAAPAGAVPIAIWRLTADGASGQKSAV